jgi:hypothetical protein
LANVTRSSQQATVEASDVRVIFDVLCDAYHKRKLSLEALRNALRKLVVSDSRGRLWTIGVKSGKWYRHTRGKWVEDEPRGPLTSARLNTGADSQTLEPRGSASQETVLMDRRARRSQELKEDRLAEEERRRRGLTADQDLEEIREARPVFMEEYDKREHQRVLRLWKDNEEREKARGRQPLPGRYNWYTGPPPKKPWVYDLERYLSELTPEQLRLYENWKPKIDSFWRRFPEKWK